MHESSPSKIWRMQKYRYKLLGSYCTKCKKSYYPAKAICKICHNSENIKETELLPEGKILSWSVIHVAPNGFEKLTPYIIALVKLKEGPVILSQVVGLLENEVKKGMRVRGVFRKLGQPEDTEVIKYGIKFASEKW
jgi:uncharacterized OB-fold protein